MPEAREEAVRAAFASQAVWCERMGSPFTAILCRLLGERLDRSTPVGARMLDWPGDPDGWADGLPLRLCGGLHALVRRRDLLAAVYPPHPADDDRLWTAVAEALARAGDFLLPWLDNPPQTNEVGRAGPLMSALLAAAAAYPLPIRLFELGASAGLNLILDRYRYTLGDTAAGDSGSPLHLRPDWSGASPPDAPVRLIGRRAVDIAPLDVRKDAERLLAYVWADQPERLRQLETALAIALANQPLVEAGDAAEWLERALDPAPEDGVLRVVMHSVAFQYFPQAAQRRIGAHMAAVGARATAAAPLAWLRFERQEGDDGTSLRLLLYPGGEDRLLATCQAHGRAINWRPAPAH